RNTQPLPQLIQAKWIGQWQSFPAGLRRLVRVEDLIKNPGSDKNPEQSVLIRNADQHHKDQDMDQRLDELAVVHRPHARYESEQECQSRIRPIRLKWAGH